MHLTMYKEAPCWWASFISEIQNSKTIIIKWIAMQQRALLQILDALQGALTLGLYDLAHPVAWEVSVVEEMPHGKSQWENHKVALLKFLARSCYPQYRIIYLLKNNSWHATGL